MGFQLMEIKRQLCNILAPNVNNKGFLYHIDQKKTRKRKIAKAWGSAGQRRLVLPHIKYCQYLLPMLLQKQDPA